MVHPSRQAKAAGNCDTIRALHEETSMARYGMSIPLGEVPLWKHEDLLKKMIDWGYTDFWSSEAIAPKTVSQRGP